MRLALFLFAESIFNLGLSVFFLLYNLYLIDRGYDEAFLGRVSSLLTVGSVCGALPAGWFAARFGLAAALRVTFAAGSGICALQAWASTRPALLALSFAGGLAAAFRAVTIAPAVAQLSTPETRPRAFSLFFALGIGMGILGGLIGGRLPDSMTKQAALWAGCAFAALALIPNMWLRFAIVPHAVPAEPRPPGSGSEGPGPPPPPPGLPAAHPSSAGATSAWRSNPFVRQYLLAAFAWSLFLGAFPPFFNAFFARRLGAGPAAIGLVFSVSQMAQVGAILAAPVLLGRLGLRSGISVTQLAAALLLAMLAPRWSLPAAAVVYAAYMSFQYMSEPGWHTLLMNSVSPEQQSGAASLNFFVMFSAQAVAAAAFGEAAVRLGYPAALLAASGVGLAAALLFRVLITSQTSDR